MASAEELFVKAVTITCTLLLLLFISDSDNIRQGLIWSGKSAQSGVNLSISGNFSPIISPRLHRTRRERHGTRDLIWVHTPKTGSTFCLVLQYDKCSKEWPKNISSADLFLTEGCGVIEGFRCPIESVKHRPLPLDQRNDDRRVVIVLRNPKSRVVSAFADSHHTEGMRDRTLRTLRAREQAAQLEMCSDQTDDKCLFNAALLVYANETKGCVVRTLNGFFCYDTAHGPPTESQVKFARRRLSRFLFVGVFEKWSEMIEGFSRLRKWHVAPESNALEVIGNAHLRQGTYLDLYDPEVLESYTDEYDEQVYETALELWSKEQED